MSTTSPGNQSPEEIETTIGQTRAEMEQTIDAIQRRLHPQRLASDITETMIGITNDVTTQVRSFVDDTLQDVASFVSRVLDQNPIASTLSSLGYAIATHRPTTSGASNMVSENVQATLNSANQRVQQTAGQIHDQAQEFTQQAQTRVTHARNRFEQVIQDNPLLVGALALTTGVAVGLMIPTTSQENRLFGNTRDRLVERTQSQMQQATQQAQQMAKDAVHRVQSVAEEAKEAAANEARKQGLVGDGQSSPSGTTEYNG